MLDTLFPIFLIGLIWGVTNPLVKRGSVIAERKLAAKRNRGVLQQWIVLLSTPSFLLPQALNQCGSGLFIYLLGTHNISLVVPAANAASLVFNAVTDVVLGESYNKLLLLPGVMLVACGIMLCSMGH